jgi:hypothetical protein
MSLKSHETVKFDMKLLLLLLLAAVVILFPYVSTDVCNMWLLMF